MSNDQKYEYIKHLKGLSLHTYFVSIDQRLQHWHGDVEILFVVRGSVQLSVGQDLFSMNKGDIIVINHFEIHSLRQATENNLLFVVQFDPAFCKRYFSEMQYIRFDDRLLNKDRDAESWTAVRAILIETIEIFAAEQLFYQFQLVSQLNRLVFTLLRNLPFKMYARKEIDSYENNLERLNRILIHIQNNAQYKITLDEIAKDEGLSTFYLSHFIRQHLGVSYQEYLSQVRLNKAAGMLATTQKSVSSIAMESGFSDIRYLRKHFESHLGCSPEAYRKRNEMTEQPMLPIFAGQSREQLVDKARLKELIQELSEGQLG